MELQATSSYPGVSAASMDVGGKRGSPGTGFVQPLSRYLWSPHPVLSSVVGPAVSWGRCFSEDGESENNMGMAK